MCWMTRLLAQDRKDRRVLTQYCMVTNTCRLLLTGPKVLEDPDFKAKLSMSHQWNMPCQKGIAEKPTFSDNDNDRG